MIHLNHYLIMIGLVLMTIIFNLTPLYLINKLNVLENKPRLISWKKEIKKQLKLLNKTNSDICLTKPFVDFKKEDFNDLLCIVERQLEKVEKNKC